MNAALVEAASGGDRLAQAELLRRLQDRWFRTCLSLLGDADLARDAVQKTAMRFLKRLGRFAARSALETWATNKAINQREKALEVLREMIVAVPPDGPLTRRVMSHEVPRVVVPQPLAPREVAPPQPINPAEPRRPVQPPQPHAPNPEHRTE